jgi:hypothetical protein
VIGYSTFAAVSSATVLSFYIPYFLGINVAICNKRNAGSCLMFGSGTTTQLA